jgi:hypothetical protein
MANAAITRCDEAEDERRFFLDAVLRSEAAKFLIPLSFNP